MKYLRNYSDNYFAFIPHRALYLQALDSMAITK
jgi:hypothetical protein